MKRNWKRINWSQQISFDSRKITPAKIVPRKTNPFPPNGHTEELKTIFLIKNTAYTLHTYNFPQNSFYDLYPLVMQKDFWAPP